MAEHSYYCVSSSQISAASGLASNAIEAHVQSSVVNYWRFLNLLEQREVIPDKLNTKQVTEAKGCWPRQ